MRLFRGTTRGVALDDKKFGWQDPFLTVSQLAGQRRNIKRPLTSGQVTGFTRGMRASASITLPTTRLHHWDVLRTIVRFSAAMLSTIGRTSDDTSLSFVWDENLGSGTFTETTQVNPSRASSPDSDTFAFLAIPFISIIVHGGVSAARKPARCVPLSIAGSCL